MPKVEYLNCPVNPFLPPRKSKAETVQSSLEQILVHGSYLYLYGAVIVSKCLIVTF